MNGKVFALFFAALVPIFLGAQCDIPSDWYPKGEVTVVDFREQSDNLQTTCIIAYKIENTGKSDITQTVAAFSVTTVTSRDTNNTQTSSGEASAREGGAVVPTAPAREGGASGAEKLPWASGKMLEQTSGIISIGKPARTQPQRGPGKSAKENNTPASETASTTYYKTIVDTTPIKPEAAVYGTVTFTYDSPNEATTKEHIAVLSAAFE